MCFIHIKPLSFILCSGMAFASLKRPKNRTPKEKLYLNYYEHKGKDRELFASGKLVRMKCIEQRLSVD